MNLRTSILSGIFILALFVSCDKSSKDDPQPLPEKADAHTLRVTDFVYQAMKEVYLWNDEIPELDREYETDAKEYFKKLLVKEDKYSYITDNFEELLDVLQGTEKGYGYSLAFAWLDESRTQVAAVVEYVYPNGPAAKAGLKRGDVIVSFDGQNITEKNMGDLFNKSSITIDCIKKTGSAPEQVKLTAAKIEQNPVHTSKVFHINGKKTGYLFYINYIDKFNSDLFKVCSDFKAAGISELILDLRYNTGGDEDALVYLSSLLAPAPVVQRKDVLIFNEYNKQYEEYNRKKGINTTNYFTDSLMSANLDLQRIFILTSGGTYSASEATIVGLQPYMNVVCIGETTGGKYTGMQLFRPNVMSNGQVVPDPSLSNWAIFPVTSQYKNKNGISPKGGIVPQLNVKSFYLPMVELGDAKEPLIAKALELIGGQPVLASSRSVSTTVFQPFARKSSHFDDIKKNLIMK